VVNLEGDGRSILVAPTNPADAPVDALEVTLEPGAPGPEPAGRAVLAWPAAR
jgi:hypothetical protein